MGINFRKPSVKPIQESSTVIDIVESGGNVLNGIGTFVFNNLTGKVQTMGVLDWSEKYSVNIREIDDQHKKLISMVNHLNSAMREGKGRDALGKILGDLIEYTRTHFAHEERLMHSNGYPDYVAHKAKHKWLTDKVGDLSKEYNDGKITISLEVMTFLQDWVKNHIMGTDKQYTPFLNGKGIS